MIVGGSEVMNKMVNGSSFFVELELLEWEDRGIAGRGTFAQDSLFK